MQLVVNLLIILLRILNIYSYIIFVYWILWLLSSLGNFHAFDSVKNLLGKIVMPVIEEIREVLPYALKPWAFLITSIMINSVMVPILVRTLYSLY